MKIMEQAQLNLFNLQRPLAYLAQCLYLDLTTY